jgi:hypothetical protein
MTATPRSFYVGLTFNGAEYFPRSLPSVNVLRGPSAHCETTSNERPSPSVESVTAQFEGRLRRFRGAERNCAAS